MVDAVSGQELRSCPVGLQAVVVSQLVLGVVLGLPEVDPDVLGTQVLTDGPEPLPDLLESAMEILPGLDLLGPKGLDFLGVQGSSGPVAELPEVTLHVQAVVGQGPDTGVRQVLDQEGQLFLRDLLLGIHLVDVQGLHHVVEVLSFLVVEPLQGPGDDGPGGLPSIGLA